MPRQDRVVLREEPNGRPHPRAGGWPVLLQAAPVVHVEEAPGKGLHRPVRRDVQQHGGQVHDRVFHPYVRHQPRGADHPGVVGKRP